MRKTLCVLVMLVVIVGCNDDGSFGPTDPGGGGSIEDYTGIWYSAPNWRDWPGAICPNGLSLPCLTNRLDIQQNGDQISGTALCYDDGHIAQIEGTATSSGGTAVLHSCGSIGCWDTTYRFSVRSDGGLNWWPVDLEVTSGSWVGDTCVTTGSGYAYREATTVPVVAGVYDYYVEQGTGPCATCGGSWWNTLYVIQNEESFTFIIPDTTSGTLEYRGTVDAAGRADYAITWAQNTPCNDPIDEGTAQFSAGQVSAVGQNGCPGCVCDYTATGTRK